jgi:hypothetical protein
MLFFMLFSITMVNIFVILSPCIFQFSSIFFFLFFHMYEFFMYFIYLFAKLYIITTLSSLEISCSVADMKAFY